MKEVRINRAKRLYIFLYRFFLFLKKKADERSNQCTTDRVLKGLYTMEDIPHDAVMNQRISASRPRVSARLRTSDFSCTIRGLHVVSEYGTDASTTIN